MLVGLLPAHRDSLDDVRADVEGFAAAEIELIAANIIAGRQKVIAASSHACSPYANYFACAACNVARVAPDDGPSAYTRHGLSTLGAFEYRTVKDDPDAAFAAAHTATREAKILAARRTHDVVTGISHDKAFSCFEAPSNSGGEPLLYHLKRQYVDAPALPW